MSESRGKTQSPGKRGRKADRCSETARAERSAVSAAPDGACGVPGDNPTAHAVGYYLPLLRSLKGAPYFPDRDGRRFGRNSFAPHIGMILSPPPSLPSAHSAGAERRQKVAHGVSRGFGRGNRQSPGGAAEISALAVPLSDSVASNGVWFLREHVFTPHPVGHSRSLLCD